MSSWWPWVAVAVVLLFGVGLVVRAVFRTGSALLQERRLAKVKEAPIEVRPAATLRDVESMLLAADDGLRMVLRGTWREWLGFGNAALRQRELVHAWGELVQAQRALRELGRSSGLDVGEDVPLVEDPMHALAARGSWLLWGALMLLPWFFRSTYTFVSLRRQVRPLVDRAQALEEVVKGLRPAAQPQPSRLVLARVA